MPSAAAAFRKPSNKLPHGLPEPDDSVAEMRAFLARTRPQSPSEALRLLRIAYPDAPLGARVAACGLARD